MGKRNWRRHLPSALIAALLSLPGASLRAQPDDDAIDLKQVPPRVLEAARNAAPSLRMSHAYKEDDDGETTYEVCGRDPQGRSIEVEITARGVVQQVETAVKVAAVPKPVLDAVRSRARGMKLNKVETITRGGRLIGYEFEGENASGDDVEVTVSPDGAKVAIEVLDDSD